jgi:predicted histidine transporter YuiF (NhaC family)
MNQKDFWKSKTFWVNLIAIIVFVIQMLWIKDFVIPVEIQGAILAVINFILRWATKEEIIWDTRKLKR